MLLFHPEEFCFVLSCRREAARRMDMGPTSVIAITQFVFIALGTMAVMVLVNAGAIPASGQGQPLALFLKHYGLWLMVLPVLWALYANVAGRVNKGPLLLNLAHGIGCVLAGALLLVYAAAILFGGN